MQTKSLNFIEDDSFSYKMSAKCVRIAVLGNVDSGKSTLIGTLTKGNLDNGKGMSRSQIMTHKHEIETGRTSTINSYLLGYQSDSESVIMASDINATHDFIPKISITKSEHELIEQASSLVSLMDLAGHEKYLKTTIHGISSGMIDYALILVDSKQSSTHMTKHHIDICCAFSIPFVIVLTKLDGCPNYLLKNTKAELGNILRFSNVGKVCYAIKNENDIDLVKEKMTTLIPVVSVSCVSGEGLNILNKFLFSLPKRRKHYENKMDRPFEFLVEDVFHVEGVGSVVSGFVNAGKSRIGEKIYVGPFDDGSFVQTVIKSAHISRVSVDKAVPGASICFNLSLKKKHSKFLRSGMFGMKELVNASFEFDADMYVLKGTCTTISKNYEAMLNILHIRQSANVTKIKKN